MLSRLLAYNYTAGAEAVPAISCLISTGGGYSQKPTGLLLLLLERARRNRERFSLLCIKRGFHHQLSLSLSRSLRFSLQRATLQNEEGRQQQQPPTPRPGYIIQLISNVPRLSRPILTFI